MDGAIKQRMLFPLVIVLVVVLVEKPSAFSPQLTPGARMARSISKNRPSPNSVLPLQPNLEHLRNEAKALLKAHAARDAGVSGTLRLLHRFEKATDAEILNSRSGKCIVSLRAQRSSLSEQERLMQSWGPQFERLLRRFAARNDTRACTSFC
jgi:hypothetical protein